MGITAGTLLIEDAEPPKRTLVPCLYIDRASLGAPRPDSAR